MASTVRPVHPSLAATNQPPPLEPVDLFSSDPVLVEGVGREGAAWAAGALAGFGAEWGGAAMQECGRLANANPPQLKVVDRFGHRLDEVEFHPAYHEIMRASSRAGWNVLPWSSGEDGRFVARTAAMVVATQVDAGHTCPQTMSFASIPALRHEPALAARWEPLLTAADYDPVLRPRAELTSAKAGMGMTEKQGGSDVRTNVTTATPIGDGTVEITGHKWFCSAPMCDVFLVLAQGEEGLGCYLVPRILDDGTRNPFRLQRLKDKLGDRSNASSEVEFDRTVGFPVGPPDRGLQSILTMVGHSRLDCVTGSAGLMRAALAQATWHAAHRSAFGRRLAEQPLMQNVLADLALESEAATTTALRLARAYDEGDEPIKRLGTAIAKYWVCKRTPAMVAEALECLGGNGFVEESGMPRLLRQSPLNSIWEGSGNVNALDVLRVLTREPDVLEAFWAELELGRGAHAALDRSIADLRESIGGSPPAPFEARVVVERLALTWQATLLARGAPDAVADAFIAARLVGPASLAFGTLPAGVDAARIVARSTPLLAS